MIDAHIHLDWYQPDEQEQLIQTLQADGMIAVASDFESCQKVWWLAQKYPFVYPAFGWHPEQALPPDQEINRIFQEIEQKFEKIVAIGEVGLPYYTKRNDDSLDIAPYHTILERFIQAAKSIICQSYYMLFMKMPLLSVICLKNINWNKPIFIGLKGIKLRLTV